MIPPWNHQHVLPLVLSPSESLRRDNRAPYRATVLELIDRFAINAERMRILEGFLQYRSALRDKGIHGGFQWIGGSFVEDVEQIELRTPNDIDVVSFFYPIDLNPNIYVNLFDVKNTKANFHVDASGIRLGRPLTPEIVSLVGYWYGMWAHRRDGSPKGFVEVDLTPDLDSTASEELNQRRQVRGWT